MPSAWRPVAGKSKGVRPANAKFQYCRKEDRYPDFVPFDHFESTVVMLSGLPGAGTYTYVFHHYQD
jgi:hypothetical protein